MTNSKYNKHEDRTNNYNKDSLSENKRYALDNTIMINELSMSEYTTDNIIKYCKLSDDDLDIIKKICNDPKNIKVFSSHIDIDIFELGLQSLFIAQFLFLSLCTYYARKRESEDPDIFKVYDLEEILIDKIDDFNNHSELIRPHESKLWLTPENIYRIILQHKIFLSSLVN